MAIDSIATLLTVIRRTQIFAPEQADEIESELVPHFEDPFELAEHLVHIEWLTAYQYETLFAGEWHMLALGQYTLLERLGAGGVGEVYKAWDTVRGRVVALKLLHTHRACPQSAVRHFEREMEVLPRFNHPNVIRVLETGCIGDRPYLTMECVEGTDLGSYVRENGPLPIDYASEYVRQVAQGLQHVHQYGFVHRDLKPANLFLINPPVQASSGFGQLRRGPDPLIKIIDWGLAKIFKSPDQLDGSEAPGSDSETGFLSGTVDYLSPEQARGACTIDTRSDIYSLGCTFVYLLTGQPPFPGQTLMQKLTQHQEGPLPSLRDIRPDVPEELEQVIHKMLAKDPGERYQIPLLVASPLRKFGPGAAAGSVIRTPGSGVRPALKGIPKPGTSLNLSQPDSAPPPRRTPGSGAYPQPGQNGKQH